MPFAGVSIPSIQLQILECYLKERGVNIKSRHLYLKAAEFYGINNYNMLITKPNESYTAQMIFSKYVFPEHWKENENNFREYFKRIVPSNTNTQKNFTFEDYVEKTDQFYNWVIEKVNWEPYDIIGFTLNYGQFLPSLAIAKKIKEIDTEKKIVFGGSRTFGEIGKRVLGAFDYVDFIVSGDGEDALYHLASDYQNYESIPRLIFRKGAEVIWNESDKYTDLNKLSTPSLDSYYEELNLSSAEIQQYYQYHGRIPIEISRGCWWNKCTFCNYNIHQPCYREKNVNKIVEEIKVLSDKYKMLNFQIIGNTLHKMDYRSLFEEIKKLGRDYNFFTEARAGQLRNNDYKIMRETGFTNIQTGIESISESYLKKINKGTRVIDNIAALKLCKDYDIINEYNLIVNYPNEEKIDFEETKKNIQLIKKYLDPPNLNKLLVGYGGFIYNNPELFNIGKLDYTDIDKLIYPKEILEKNISFYYNFKRQFELCENNWEQMVREWRLNRESLQIEGIKTKTTIDKLIFYFVDGGSFVKIYDKRNGEDIRIYVLDETERKIFLACIDVTSRQELQKLFPDIPDYKLGAILDTFEQSGIVFHENDFYLSLPLRCNIKYAGQPVEEEMLLVSD